MLNSDKLMYLMQSDISDISQYVIDELAKKQIDLKEGARKVLIAKAIKARREYGSRMMRELLLWEINLIAQMVADDKNVIVKTRVNTIKVCHKSNLSNRSQLDDYFNGIGVEMYLDGDGYYKIDIPRSYNPADVRQRIKSILYG